MSLWSCDDSPSTEPAVIGEDQNSVVRIWKLMRIDVKIEDEAVKVSDQGLENNFYTNSKYIFTEEGSYIFTFSDGEVFEGTYNFNKETN